MSGHTVRLINRIVDVAVPQGDGFSFYGLGLVPVIFEIARGPSDFDQCFPKRLALFFAEQFGVHLVIFKNVLAHGFDQTAPFNWTHCWQNTRVVHSFSRLDGSIDV